MPRTPNAICDQCGKEFYRRPSQQKKYKNSYCSRKCFAKSKVVPDKKCAKCGNPFHPSRATHRFCSVICASSVPKPRHGKFKGVRDWRQRRLMKMYELFGFDSCMVEGCDYDKTYDVHRLKNGRDGGKYEIGNMFAICPNHHAESHRGIAVFEKVNDGKLRVIYTEGQANVEVAAASKAVRS